MNLNTIVMDPIEAAERLAHYEEALAKDRNSEDVAMAQAFRAAKRGLPMIKLSEVIRAGGTFDDGLPRLAVARANALRVDCRVQQYSAASHADLTFANVDEANDRWSRRTRGRGVTAHAVHVSLIADDGWTRPQYGSKAGRTMVPPTPPQHRPKRGRLASCHVLWEVEQWDPTPPVDPALIRHIRGDLWVVLAVWDLTELERAVLSQR